MSHRRISLVNCVKCETRLEPLNESWRRGGSDSWPPRAGFSERALLMIIQMNSECKAKICLCLSYCCGPVNKPDVFINNVSHFCVSFRFFVSNGGHAVDGPATRWQTARRLNEISNECVVRHKKIKSKKRELKGFFEIGARDEITDWKPIFWLPWTARKRNVIKTPHQGTGGIKGNRNRKYLYWNGRLEAKNNSRRVESKDKGPKRWSDGQKTFLSVLFFTWPCFMTPVILQTPATCRLFYTIGCFWKKKHKKMLNTTTRRGWKWEASSSRRTDSIGCRSGILFGERNGREIYVYYRLFVTFFPAFYLLLFLFRCTLTEIVTNFYWKCVNAVRISEECDSVA